MQSLRVVWIATRGNVTSRGQDRARRHGGLLPSWCCMGIDMDAAIDSLLVHRCLYLAVMSCPILSCLVLSYPVLSCPVLSCLVLSFLILSCPVLFCLVLSYPVLSCPFLSCLVLSFFVLSFFVLSFLVLSCSVLSYPVCMRLSSLDVKHWLSLSLSLFWSGSLLWV